MLFLQSSTQLGDTGEMYLINEGYLMVSPSRFAGNTVLTQRISSANAKQCYADLNIHTDPDLQKTHREDIAEYVNYAGREVLGTHAYIPAQNWCLIYEVGTDEVRSQISSVIGFVAAVGITFIAVLGILFWIVGKRISDPIVKLSHGVDLIQQGHTDHKVGTDRSDEIGHLSRMIDSMKDKIKEKHSHDK